MTNKRSRRGDVLSAGGTTVFGAVLLLLTLVLLKAGWCSCTMFALTSWALIGSATLLLGNRTFGVLAEEKEKKTLDCLRLTQLSASSLFWYKLAPEFRSLARLLASLSPAVWFSAWASGQGLAAGTFVVAIAALGGALSIIMSLFVSSLSATSSRAVVHGWTLKACWLLLTPVLDTVVSAVTVTSQRAPVFDTLNPFAAVWPLVVPEAASGFRAELPLVFLAVTPLLCGLMWWVAARRYEQGLTASPTLTDREVHQIYKRTPSWVPSFLGVRDNPVFMRELASQLRSGAGKWPGYAVFVTLFLAPYLYSQSWNVRRSAEAEMPTAPPLRVETTAPDTNPATGELRSEPVLAGTERPSFVRLSSWDGTELRLKGHTDHACLRMALYNDLRVPLPASQVVKVEQRDPFTNFEASNQEPAVRPGPAEVSLSDSEAASYGVSSAPADSADRNLSETTLDQIRLHSLSQGLFGCMMLLSLYLGVRCSGFLAGAVTSEQDRRSWTDLALTGIGPRQVLDGKVIGTLLMPVIQLLVASPSLLLFVWAGALSPAGAVELVSYAALLAVTAGLIGFWASSASGNSHSAQGLALLSVVSWLPLSFMFSHAGSAVPATLALGLAGLTFARSKSSTMARGWGLVAVGSLLAPEGLSPWTCLPAALGTSNGLTAQPLVWFSGMLCLAGLATVCYAASLRNLQQPGQEDTLRAELVA